MLLDSSVFTGPLKFKAKKLPYLILKHLGFDCEGVFFNGCEILLTFHLPVVLCCSIRKANSVSEQRRCFETLSPFGESMQLGKGLVLRNVCAQI